MNVLDTEFDDLLALRKLIIGSSDVTTLPLADYAIIYMYTGWYYDYPENTHRYKNSASIDDTSVTQPEMFGFLKIYIYIYIQIYLIFQQN